MIITLTKIGNSKGIIIPARLLKQFGLEREVSLEIEDNKLVISNVQKPRDGWKKAFIEAGAGTEKNLIDGLQNDFDKEDWTW